MLREAGLRREEEVAMAMGLVGEPPSMLYYRV